MKNFSRLAFLAAVVWSVAGCQAGPNEVSKAEDAKMRAQLDAPFDINKVPADKREMVRAMMEANRRGNAPKGAPPAKAETPTK